MDFDISVFQWLIQNLIPRENYSSAKFEKLDHKLYVSVVRRISEHEVQTPYIEMGSSPRKGYISETD